MFVTAKRKKSLFSLRRISVILGTSLLIFAVALLIFEYTAREDLSFGELNIHLLNARRLEEEGQLHGALSEYQLSLRSTVGDPKGEIIHRERMADILKHLVESKETSKEAVQDYCKDALQQADAINRLDRHHPAIEEIRSWARHYVRDPAPSNQAPSGR